MNDPHNNILRQRLAALRRKLQMVTSFHGGSWLLVVLLGTAAVAGALDWRYHLPGLVRAVFLVAGLAGAGYVTYRYLLLPFRQKQDDLSLALRVEENYPSLNDALASTIQFLDQGEADGDGNSKSLRKEAVRRAMITANDCDFNRVVNARGLRTGLASALLACAGVCALAILFPLQARTALVRLLDPFGVHDWPTQTVLEMEAPRERMGRNDAFVLRGTVKGVIPEHATLVLHVEGSSPREKGDYPIRKTGEETGSLEIRLAPGEMTRNFKVQVRAHDTQTTWYDVKVLPPPVLTDLDGLPSPRVTLYYPEYTGLPSPQKLSPGTGNIPESVVGTRVSLRAAADRPLRRAWIEYLPEPRSTPLVMFLGTLGATTPADAVTLTAAGQSVWGQVDAELDDDDASRFTLRFAPSVGGFYVLHLEDDLGLHNTQLFELRIRPDPAPTVMMHRPSEARDMLRVMPGARMPLEVVAEDPTFALRSVYLRYRTVRGPAQAAGEQPRRWILYNETQGKRKLSAWAGSIAENLPIKLRPARMEFQRTLSIRSFAHEDGSPLRDGDVLVIQPCADDFDDVTVNKEPGTNNEVRIYIVGRNGMEDELSEEQRKLRDELLEMRKKEREAIDKVTKAEQRLERAEPLTPDEQADLLRAEQLQQQIQEQTGSRTAGLRARLDRLRAALRQNQLDDTPTADRIEEVAQEVDRLADNELPQIATRLAEARRQAELIGAKPIPMPTGTPSKQELEQKAAEAEKQARAARLTEEQQRQQAERAAKLADEARDSDTRAKRQEEAERHQKLAEEARQKAEDQERRMADLRNQAAQQPDPEQTRKDLGEVRKLQEDVEAALNQLLARLEPWSNLREVTGEARQLLSQQQQLRNATSEMQSEIGAGKRPEELTPEEKAELQNLVDAQKQLEERAEQLFEQMKRMADQKQDKDPAMAQELREAQKDAAAKNITGQMETARNQIDQNKLGDAATTQKNVAESIQEMIKNLENRNEAQLDRLTKKMREVEKKLRELEDEQDRLRKKIKDAQQEKDPAARQAAMQNLRGEQQRLLARSKQLAEELKTLRSQRAQQALEDAAAEMEDALKRLERGEEKEEDQDEILDRLAEAQEELERTRRQNEEELDRIQLEGVAKALKRLKERHEGLMAEAHRIQDTVQRDGMWTRVMLGSLITLGENQGDLAEELAAVGERDLKGAIVIARMIKNAADAMTQAGQKFSEMTGKQPPVATLPDKETTRLQELANRRLEQVLEAIQEEIDAPQSRRNQGGGQGGQGGQGGMEGQEGGGPRAPGDSIPPLAEMKLLRTLEVEIRQQMVDFKKDHPDLTKLDEKDQAHYQSLIKQRQEVRELFDELTRPDDEGATP